MDKKFAMLRVFCETLPCFNPYFVCCAAIDAVRVVTLEMSDCVAGSVSTIVVLGCKPPAFVVVVARTVRSGVENSFDNLLARRVTCVDCRISAAPWGARPFDAFPLDALYTGVVFTASYLSCSAPLPPDLPFHRTRLTPTTIASPSSRRRFCAR